MTARPPYPFPVDPLSSHPNIAPVLGELAVLLGRCQTPERRADLQTLAFYLTDREEDLSRLDRDLLMASLGARPSPLLQAMRGRE